MAMPIHVFFKMLKTQIFIF